MNIWCLLLLKELTLPEVVSTWPRGQGTGLWDLQRMTTGMLCQQEGEPRPVYLFLACFHRSVMAPTYSWGLHLLRANIPWSGLHRGHREERTKKQPLQCRAKCTQTDTFSFIRYTKGKYKVLFQHADFEHRDSKPRANRFVVSLREEQKWNVLFILSMDHHSAVVDTSLFFGNMVDNLGNSFISVGSCFNPNDIFQRTF